MTRKFSTLDENHGDDTAAIQLVRSIQVVLPKLSAMTLQREAFAFYDASLKNGEPTAARIAEGLMKVPGLEQKTAAARRSEWSRSRCCEYLRHEAAALNKELTDIAANTKSQAVRASIVDAIYSAIIADYPHLKVEAADMAVRRKLELTKGGRNGAAAMSQAPEPEAPATALEAPKATLAGVADVGLVQRQANQVANLIVLCLKTVNQVVVPQAQAVGITLDAQQTAALTMNMLICLQNGSKSHWKMPTEVEVSK